MVSQQTFAQMQFSNVIGHNAVKKQLTTSVLNGRIPHAQLFFGPEGCGSLPLALAYVQFVACSNKSENDSCGSCPSCLKFSKLTHPDLHFSYPVNTSKQVSKDPTSDDYIKHWRERIQKNPYFRSSQWYNFIGIENKQGILSKRESELTIKKLNLKSFESEYKFLILWLPEKMNATSANMLLKLIEEPPSKTLFLLVSEIPEQVLITISSRTQPVKLSRIDTDSMIDALKNKHQLNPDEAKSTARLANGNFIAALEILETSEENVFNFEHFTRLMRLSYSRNIQELNIWVDEMASAGRERLRGFFDYSLKFIRENFIMNLNNEQLLYLSREQEQFSQKFHPFINGRNVMSLVQEMNQACADIERNANSKIVLFDLALKIVKLIRK